VRPAAFASATGCDQPSPRGYGAARNPRSFHVSRFTPSAFPTIVTRMSVQNRILKIQKRNRALVRFDPDRMVRAISRAAESIGGFQSDFLPDVNGRIFDMHRSDDAIAAFSARSSVIRCK